MQLRNERQLIQARGRTHDTLIHTEATAAVRQHHEPTARRRIATEYAEKRTRLGGGLFVSGDLT
ncbi:MAG: hypothetical protein JWM95_4577 [Gemmatimonadetes bacterium]|nr:hypothetical protein [Gemmatimonadota bacterium]